jgi:hypothetical protein
VDFTEKQIAPPKSWEKFEELCLALFKEIWGDPLALRHGRRGQPQHGVDIYGCVDTSGASFQGVQCKGKDANYGAKASVAELKAELTKADQFDPPLQKWIFATTSPADVKLQTTARKLSEERAKKGRFSVIVLGWEDFQSLLATHPDVLKLFYPEHAFDLAEVVRVLKTISNTPAVNDLNNIAMSYSPAAVSPGRNGPSVWLPVKFTPQRDLKPALMGRHLGPADAVSCPRLLEAQTLIEELARGYFARLVGEAGAGKSICAFQTAHHFEQAGWRVLTLADPSVHQIDLDDKPSPKTLYLIDDAHLVAPWVLGRAEGQANQTALLLSTHNSVEQSAARHGSIILDAKRAVRTIATALRKTLPDTLRMVKEVDDQVSDGPMDEPIEWRLDQAELNAERPWQLCFILGGGWRRAKQLTDSARASGADIILAIAGLRQIASRDARCSLQTLSALLAKTSLPVPDLDRSISWLTGQRLLISSEDLRTPHQRFAAVALVQVLRGQTETGQSSIWEACRHLLQDPHLPLAGLRTLLHELNFNNGITWHSRIQRSWLEPLESRCWTANDADLPVALLTLSEILSRSDGWPQALSNEQRLKIVAWLSRPNNQTGYGLHQLLNSMRNADEEFARTLVGMVDATSAATTYSEVSTKSAFSLGKYLSIVWQLATERWKSQFLATLNKAPLLRLAESWPSGEPISIFTEYCRSTYWADQALGLDMAERFIPRLVKEIEKEPAGTFHEFSDVAWHVLKGIDVLGIYAKKHRQTKREAGLCRSVCEKLDAKNVGERLSHVSKRQFQPAAWLLDFLRRAAPDVFKTVVRAIDWSAINATIGDDWENLFHDGETFLRVASADAEIAKTITTLVDERMSGVTILPPRLALLSPKLTERHLDSKRAIGLGSHDHVDWLSGTVIVGKFVKSRPDLIPVVLEPLVKPVSTLLSKSHPSFWRDAHLFFHLIRQVAPEFLCRMLDGVDVSTAESNWVTGVKSPPDIRRATTVLIDAAAERDDDLGKMAVRIREKYPSRAKPIKSDLEEFTFS